MQSPLEISWHQVDKSETLDARIREHAAKLDNHFDGIISCRVSVEKPHGRHRQGNIYRLCIELEVPGKSIVVGRDPEKNHAHEDVYVSLRDAFDAVTRQLEDYARKRRGKTKQHDHEALHKAQVVRLFPDDGYGFLLTPDAREIFFEANDVVGMPFGHLQEGMAVSFVEEMGNEGPKAARVLTGKHDIGL